MEREPKLHADPRMHHFLVDAISEGVHRIAPESPQAWVTWAKARNITGLYYGTPLSMGEIGQRYGYSEKNTREGPRQMITHFVARLYANCSPQLQERHPLDQLPLAKPAKPLTEAHRARISEVRGGKLAEVKNLVKAGVVHPGEIAQRIRREPQYVSRVMVGLRRRGEAPPKRSRQLLETAQKASTFTEQKNWTGG